MSERRSRRRVPASKPSGRSSPPKAPPKREESAPAPATAAIRRVNAAAVLLVALTALVAFWPALGNGFVRWDDHVTLEENYRFRGLGWPEVRWAWTTFLLGTYQPIGWMIYEAEYAAWGLDPRGYHLVSLALHAACSAALYAVAVALVTRSLPELAPRAPARLRFASALGVSLFAAHPLRAEVVAWATAQTYLPCALFTLLSVLAYLRADDLRGCPGRLAWLAASVILYAASLLSHAVSIGLAAVFVLLDVFPLQRLGGSSSPRTRGVWWEKVPFFVLSLACVAVSVRARESVEVPDPASQVAQAGYGVGFYAIRSVLPYGITTFSPRPAQLNLTTFPYPVYLLAALAVTVALVAARRRHPGLLVAWLSYLAILAPNSGLVRIGAVLVADRYSYLATMPLVVAASAGIFRLVVSGRPRVVAAVAAAGVAAVAGFTVLSWRQCSAWSDTVAFWSHALERGAGDSPEVRLRLAEALVRKGQPQEAAPHLREAVRLRIPDARFLGALGKTLIEAGDIEGGILQIREALRLDPDDAEVRKNLGYALATKGAPDEAVEAFREAVRLAPGDPDALSNLGYGLAARGDDAEAVDAFRAALRIAPEHVDALSNLGFLLTKAGKTDEAIEVLRRAVRLAPKHIDARTNLGAALKAGGALDEAVDELRAALRIQPGYAEAQGLLDEALRLQNGRGPAGPP